jgi:hypothetical protein
VFAKLIGLPDGSEDESTPATLPISKAGKVVGKFTTDKQGKAVIRFDAGSVPANKHKALVTLIENFLKS